MVLPAVALGIGAAGLAAAGGVAGQSKKKTPVRQLSEDEALRQRQLELMMQQYKSAQGLEPSIADMQMREGLEQARAAQASAAASARGPNMALAQRTAANQAGAIQSDIAGQAGMARLEEIMAARQAAYEQTSGIRSQDLEASRINLEAQIARDKMELERRQKNKDRLYGSLTMGAAAVGKMGTG